jgi:hypothetical protein
MTREDIIQMARQTGSLIELAQEKDLLWLEAFAKLVAQHEREACAKLADEWAVGWPHPSTVIAESIRARSKE